ncbi:MAG TPA: tetratricopeptide repeat protein [candidate division Zixibacteria bacterium]|nr:tetratricopeptide repeat protein [candidate division Zixibacteria bacterium]
MKRLLTPLAIFLLTVSIVWGQENDPKKLFAEANRLYDAQNYPGAIQLYEQLAGQGARTPALYYNLASAHFKTKAIGQSVLYLLRAQKLSPGDDDIEGNLRFVSQFTIDKGTLSSPPLAFFTELFPLGTWALWGTVCYFLLAGIIALRIWFKSRAFLLRWGTWLAGILLAVFAFGFYLSWSWSKVPKGVLLAKEAPVKSGPGDDFVTQLLGHEGLTFQILEEREDYFEVLLPNGVKGWVKKEEAAKV